ncbi:cytochrome-c oxidase [Nibricoccus aquaticus]|uniref:Cytochrome-c oxidase n=1 Tax=Nibricoccus aquaticus TaxID=2576891 RepID=A0A290QEU3_9BACT|nr:cbb3-type cytochrome c oxidase subunit II [Nibricoccus aquaticus]ATC62871.1 cytochrome-c oxidase [Nibricoccus aquaticus]
MNRAPLIFLGIFFALAFSWTGIVLTNQIAYGKLEPVFDEGENKSFPEALPGLAAQGKLVYQDLGCIYCHTQQVRRPGYGGDIDRGWGERQSVARDYIRERRVLLGTMRTGPDLRNIGARQAGDAGREWHIRHMYDPEITSKDSIMPKYKFLFETRKIVGEPSTKAVQRLLPASAQPAAGYEIVLTDRGNALIEYLLSLKDSYTYPEEATRVYVEPKKEQKAGASSEAAKPEAHK